MRFLFFFTILFCFIVTDSFAQSGGEVRASNQLKLDYLTPGITYERAIGKKTTIVGSLHFDVLADMRGAGLFPKPKDFSGIGGIPAIGLRRYYNLPKRVGINRLWRNNSGEYFGLMGQYLVNLDTRKGRTQSLGILWGIQRTYRRLGFDLSGGVGYTSAKSFKVNLGPIGLASLSYVF